ncbi:MAG TPA: hypothetical protein VGT78_05340 [Rhizomicrobium sp.]|nr:hypothetical protein [Rhizomicrobium sp.]
MTAYVSISVANAEDADRPLLWIELGGQMENVSGQGEIFAPPFLAANPNSPVLGPVTPLQAQKPPKFGFGEEGKISFQPEDSDWIFSAAIRYGKSSNAREVQHQTSRPHVSGFNPNVTAIADFSDTMARHQETHAIVDFSAGKDVGLGVLGKDGSSALSLGVRIAQFTSKADSDLRARPDLRIKYYAYPGHPFQLKYFHTYHAMIHAVRGFHGIGPTLSWNGSVPFVGNQQDGELTFDWGANAAILFGKQKARVRHQQSAHYDNWKFLAAQSPYRSVYHHSGGHTNVRSVTVPNVGGFAGISYRYANAKISLGYRADVFFGAMDTGIDAVKKSNAAFNGPFASISVGIGD